MKRFLSVVCLIVGLAGCQSFYFLTDPNKTKDVKAEYGKVGNRSLAVVVWTDQATRDEYSRAKDQVCQSVTYYLKKNLPKAKITSPREIQEFQDDPGRDWQSMNNLEICKSLKVDLLVRIDLLQFTARSGDTRELRKARIAATINLYETGKGGGVDPVYSTEVDTTYPKGSLHGVSDMTDTDLLHAAVENFSEIVARKFYDHEEMLESGPSR